ncbi:hypothetical protein JX266_003713 [Neoarthrinium moseri]|nr:hypothetical protein JX266_003713 [Neoarthrinium moseri]
MADTEAPAEFQIITTLRYDARLLELPGQGFPTAAWNRTPSPWYMLDYHRDRMLRAVEYFGFPSFDQLYKGEAGLRRFESLLQSEYDEKYAARRSKMWRVKVLLGHTGNTQFEFAPLSDAVQDVTPLNNLFPSCLPAPTGSDIPPSVSIDSSKPALTGSPWVIRLDVQIIKPDAFTHFKTTKREVYNDVRSRFNLTPAERTEVLVQNPDGEVMEGTITTPYFWRNQRWVTPPVSIHSHWGGNDGTTRRFALERGIAAEEVILASSITDGEFCWLSNGVRGFMPGFVRLA